MHTEIQAALRASIGTDSPRIGPFLLHLDPDSDHPFRNYAVPDDAASPTPAEVAELIAAFTGRARLPRLEYVTPAPGVDAALHAAGFTVDLRLPLMLLEGEPVAVPPSPELRLDRVTGEADLRAAALVQNISYGAGDGVDDADVRRLQATVDGGGTVVLARYAGEPAGAGLCTPARHGLSEIAAVAVLPEYRRRHIATAVGAELSHAALAAGARPYLQTESENETRLYGRLGFVTVGELVATSRRADRDENLT